MTIELSHLMLRTFKASEKLSLYVNVLLIVEIHQVRPSSIMVRPSGHLLVPFVIMYVPLFFLYPPMC